MKVAIIFSERETSIINNLSPQELFITDEIEIQGQEGYVNISYGDKSSPLLAVKCPVESEIEYSRQLGIKARFAVKGQNHNDLYEQFQPETVIQP